MSKASYSLISIVLLIGFITSSSSAWNLDGDVLDDDTGWIGNGGLAARAQVHGDSWGLMEYDDSSGHTWGRILGHPRASNTGSNKSPGSSTGASASLPAGNPTGVWVEWNDPATEPNPVAWNLAFDYDWIGSSHGQSVIKPTCGFIGTYSVAAKNITIHYGSVSETIASESHSDALVDNDSMPHGTTTGGKHETRIVYGITAPVVRIEADLEAASEWVGWNGSTAPVEHTVSGGGYAGEAWLSGDLTLRLMKPYK